MQACSEIGYRRIAFYLCRAVRTDWFEVLRIRDFGEFVLLIFICSACTIAILLACAMLDRLGDLNAKKTQANPNTGVYRQAAAYNGTEETSGR